MDYRVVLSPSARADLRDIVRYISIDDPDEALRFGRFLISRSRLLSQSPELGRIVPEFEDALIREIIVRANHFPHDAHYGVELEQLHRYCRVVEIDLPRLDSAQYRWRKGIGIHFQPDR